PRETLPLSLHDALPISLVVGHVLEIEELTGFKKAIRFCQVQVGPGPEDTRGIICGAQNFATGDKVVVALPGAVLPGDFKITARRSEEHTSELQSPCNLV